MSLHEIYLEIPPEDIAYVKFIFESYEGVGIIRTVDRKKAVIVLMAVDDFLSTARSILTSLKNEVPLTEISRPAEIGEDWLLRDLATESPSE
ncbi:MAG: DUF4911 domain-containing protein [Deltaproteobacteria bacterium]|nr:DUF4911 domain-containing protein [Deltaproteobacteria bacterium]MCZ6625112.1 DUF4911 domain-containing protein [Deltaproteobacteria bacterium]